MAGVREVMRPRVPGARAREGGAWLAVQRDLGEEGEEDDALPGPPASSPPFASLSSRFLSSHRIALPSSLQQAVRMHARPCNSHTRKLAGRLRSSTARIASDERIVHGWAPRRESTALVYSLQFAVQCSLHRSSGVLFGPVVVVVANHLSSSTSV